MVRRRLCIRYFEPGYRLARVTGRAIHNQTEILAQPGVLYVCQLLLELFPTTMSHRCCPVLQSVSSPHVQVCSLRRQMSPFLRRRFCRSQPVLRNALGLYCGMYNPGCGWGDMIQRRGSSPGAHTRWTDFCYLPRCARSPRSPQPCGGWIAGFIPILVYRLPVKMALIHCTSDRSRVPCVSPSPLMEYDCRARFSTHSSARRRLYRPIRHVTAVNVFDPELVSLHQLRICSTASYPYER